MSLYITEIAGLTKGRSKSEESKSNKAPFDDSRGNNSMYKEEVSMHKRKAKSKKLTLTKQDFLEFLIQEETKFADLEKIEDFYDNTKIKKFSQFNKNQNLILKKKEQLKKLEETIQMALVSSFKIKEQDLVSYYDKQIKELKEKIVVREHDMECYSHTHQRLYKANVSKNIFHF
jgi:hypothetical protein